MKKKHEKPNAIYGFIEKNISYIVLQTFSLIVLLINLWIASKLSPFAETDAKLFSEIERVEAKSDYGDAINNAILLEVRDDIKEIKQDIKELK